MKSRYTFLCKSHSHFLAFLIVCLFLSVPVSELNAQGCGCTNCPQFMPDNFVGDFLISVQGADNPTLGQNGQGVCGVTMHLDHEYIGDLTITLTSPSGQSVTLVGPEGFWGPTDGTEWDISFVPCNDQANPDPGFSDIWDNDQNWGLNNFYSGSYYPNQGCLEGFNSGPVDGTWTLTVVDGQDNDVGNFYDYEIIFCDPSGILCFSCAADAGDLTQQDISACQGSPDLNLSLPPTYVPPFSPPPSAEYSYTYIVSGAGGVILAYDPGPDLSAYDPGTYNVCGLSYYTLQEADIPPPNGSLTVSQLNTQLGGGTPPFCGNISGNCVNVTINTNPPDEEVFEQVCAPDCFLFYGTNYCQSGTYVRTITNAQGCDYQATLNLTVNQPATVNLTEIVCEGECATTPGFEDHCFPGTYQELLQTEAGCDSFVILSLQVLNVLAVANANGNIDCDNPNVQISGAGSSTGSSVTYLWSASNGGHILGTNSNINVLVDEPGDYTLRVCRSGGGAFCCDSTQVTVVDNSMVPPAPTNISGPLAACPGGNAAYTVSNVTGALSYQWTVTNGSIVSGQGTNSIQVVWDINAPSGTVCAHAVNNCGPGSDLCINISLSVPMAGQITHLCDSTNTSYTVSFPVSGGTSPYTIPGGIISGGVFISNLIPNGQPYSFQITDTNLCVSSLVTGVFNCSCATNAGAMDLSPLHACENDTVTATHLGGHNLDPNDVTAFVLHSGPGTSLVPPVFGENNSGTFTFQPGMVYGQTYYISMVAGNNLTGLPDPADPCFSVAQGQPVVFYQNPVAQAGVDLDTCGLVLLLNANTGVGSGHWSVVAAPLPDTLAITSTQNANTAVTASGYGTFLLSWTLDNNGCADTDTVALDFNGTPDFGNLSHSCDGANENYSVSFQVTGGTPSYSVSGSPIGTLTGINFVSDPIPTGNAYSLLITDSNGCMSAALNGSFTCSCSTDAGQMNLSPVSVCENDSMVAQHFGGQNFDANDTSAFFLHTLPGTVLGQILAQNHTGVFGLLPGMSFGTTYYVSYVVGTNLSGLPNLQDPCLSVAPGQPLVFHPNPVAYAGLDTATCGTVLSLQANAPPGSTGHWSIVQSPGSGNLNIDDLLSANTTATASGTGVYTLQWTLNQNNCTDVDTVNLVFNESPMLSNLARDCDSTNEHFTVTLVISGGVAPYSVNGLPFTGNVFASPPLLNGATYAFDVSDINGCTMPQVAGAFSCNCATDAGTMSAQPLQVCEGQTAMATANGDETLDPNDITAFVLHNGAGSTLGQVFAQNATGVFAFNPALMQYGTTYYISLVAGNAQAGVPDPLEPCFSVAAGQPVQWLQNPVPNAGLDQSACGNSMGLQAVASSGLSGSWSLVAGPGIASFTAPNDPVSNVSVSLSGVYTFRWTELNGICTGTDDVSATFNPLPAVSALDEICNSTNTQYTLSFTATNGLAPYTVNGLAGSFVGNNFTAAPLPSNTAYSFVLVDANGCESPGITGTHNCNCSTDAGSMQTAPAVFCADATATAIWDNNANLDTDDLLQFILHDGTGAAIGNTIYATSNQPDFAFGGNLQIGVTYYISAIAGNNQSGMVNLNDPCLSVAAGAPVQWKANPDADISGDATICQGENTVLDFGGAGAYPLTLTYTDGVNQNTVVLNGPLGSSLDVSPLATTTYTLIQVTDGSLPQCASTLSDLATVTVNEPVEAGSAGTALEFCPGAGQLVQLSTLLIGADAGGQWTETSTLPSQSGAFNASAGTFLPNGQTPGTYRFRYHLIAPAPCKDDEALVSIVIHPAPIADAGADKTLNCSDLEVSLGGPASSTGTYRWVLNGDTVGTNRQIDATEAGDYTLLVTSPQGCTATDGVTVGEDKDPPVAELTTALDVRCHDEHNGVVSVDAVSSAHQPVLYALNGGPFGASPVFTSLAPGEYVISMQDALGCEGTTDTLVVGNPAPLSADLGADLDLELADSAHVLLQGAGASLETILWQPLLDSASAGLPYQHFFPLQSVQLSVTVTDTNGCTAQDRILIRVNKPRNIFIPNIFKPEDGIEPLLYVFGGRDVAEIESFQIFDRWGEEIMVLQHFSPNDPSTGWDGTYRGNTVNPGVFVYYAIVRFIDGERVEFKGDVTVVR